LFKTSVVFVDTLLSSVTSFGKRRLNCCAIAPKDQNAASVWQSGFRCLSALVFALTGSAEGLNLATFLHEEFIDQGVSEGMKSGRRSPTPGENAHFRRKTISQIPDSIGLGAEFWLRSVDYGIFYYN